MSRTALAAVSLVAAVPAGIMAFLAIMAFLGHADQLDDMPMGSLFLVVMGAIAASGVLIALSPVVILVGPRRKRAAAQPAAVATAESGPQTAEVVADKAGESAADESLAADEPEPTEGYEFDEGLFGEEEVPEEEPPPSKKKKRGR